MMRFSVAYFPRIAIPTTRNLLGSIPHRENDSFRFLLFLLLYMLYRSNLHCNGHRSISCGHACLEETQNAQGSLGGTGSFKRGLRWLLTGNIGEKCFCVTTKRFICNGEPKKKRERMKVVTKERKACLWLYIHDSCTCGEWLKPGAKTRGPFPG
jgi:hypothetical protein